MEENTHPLRREYMRQQREKHHRRLFGVFPIQYPREILWALDILPIEIWDPPVEVLHAHAHLQTYICSVVKLGLELILRGKCDDLDGFLFPHTCDSVQNLASIVNDYLGLKIPCYFFYHPKAPYRNSSRRYYTEQLRTFAADLSERFGSLDPSKLRRCVEVSQRIAEACREIYDWRAGRELKASNAEFYGTLRMGEYLHPDDFLQTLHRFSADYRGKADGDLGVVLSGILPNPPEILSLLDRFGARVVEDDLANGSRRLLFPPSAKEEPFEALTEIYFSLPPCPTKDSPISDRLQFILERVERSGAKGVIFCMVKFCEPELFDVPLLVEGLKERGLATLIVDVELNRGVSGQLATRLEAFVEMLR
jgi:benzoyl-CoA reductase/2-hydroxyglutaryl-CoA dehydratase subunit BcrC/BadD/HgdB